MDFIAITQLNLKQAFFDIQHFQDVQEDIDFLKQLFECPNRRHLFIHDDLATGHCIYLDDTNTL